MFWTGVTNYNDMFPYTVEVHTGNVSSHTCGTQLVLPNYVQSQKELFNSLLAVIPTENFDTV